jgi:hypothetical protein
MAKMTDTEAREIIERMGGTAIADTVMLKQRITELDADHAKDPWEDTAHQIKRLKGRLEKRELEAAALAVAASMFPDGTRATHYIDKAWKFVVESYDGMDYSPVRAEWTDVDIFAFVATHHVDGLDAFRKKGK